MVLNMLGVQVLEGFTADTALDSIIPDSLFRLAAGTLHFDEDRPTVEATVYVQLHHPERRAVEFLDPAPRHGIQLLDDDRNDA